jgi:hypothetical protein
MSTRQVAKERCKLGSLENLWEWDEAELYTKDLNNRLLVTDDREKTACHYTTLWVNV